MTAKKERKGLDPRRFQWLKKDQKHEFLHKLISGVLDGECSDMDLQNENDRAYVTQALVAAFLGEP